MGDTLGRVALVTYFITQLFQGVLALFTAKSVLVFGLINTIVVGYTILPLVLIVIVLSVVLTGEKQYARLRWAGLEFFACAILSWVFVASLALPHLDYVRGTPPGSTTANSLLTAHYAAAAAGIFMTVQSFSFIYAWIFDTYVTRPWSVVHEFDHKHH